MYHPQLKIKATIPSTRRHWTTDSLTTPLITCKKLLRNIDPIEVKLDQRAFKTLNTYKESERGKWIDGDAMDAFGYAHVDKWQSVTYI